MASAGRTEYLSDRGGLFSGMTQALKEFTGTYEYKFGEEFLARAGIAGIGAMCRSF
jgi:hypothetical protein